MQESVIHSERTVDPILRQDSEPGTIAGFRFRVLTWCLAISILAHAGMLMLPAPPLLDEVPVTDEAVSVPPVTIRILLEDVMVSPDPIPEPPPPEDEYEPVLAVDTGSPEPVAAPPEEPESPPEEVVKEKENETPADEAVPEEPAQENRPAVITEVEKGVEDAYWNAVCSKIAASIRYPEQARKRGWQGVVVVTLSVDAAGRLAGTVRNGAGESPVLSGAVLDAVRRVDRVAPPPPGMPVPLEADLPIRFDL